jgi:hypothetical protein
LNDDRALAQAVMKYPGMANFFVLTNFGDSTKEPRYYGTRFLYEFYHNDIHNLWLICSACNKAKSDDDAINWFAYQWAYGDDFINHLKSYGLKENRDFMQNRHGLAGKATEWFFSKHAYYLGTSKEAFERISQPLMLLGKAVDEAKLAGKQHAVLLEASRMIKERMAQAAAHVSDENIMKKLPKPSGKQESEALIAAVQEATNENADDLMLESAEVLTDAAKNIMQKKEQESEMQSKK